MMDDRNRGLVRTGGFRKLLVVIALAAVLLVACHTGMVKIGPALLKALLAGLLFPFPC